MYLEAQLLGTYIFYDIKIYDVTYIFYELLWLLIDMIILRLYFYKGLIY